MAKKMSEENKKKGRYILYSLVFLVLGFIFAFSYRTLGKDSGETSPSPTFQEEEQYRADLIVQKERNKELTDEMRSKQAAIREFEQSFSENEENHAVLVEEAKDLRLLLGVIPAVGPGVRVTLKDGDYDPIEQNPNDYIVHESHVLRVVNELKISGAQGIAINGQRISSNSYIKCTGPVIQIDGRTLPAPFVVEAIGDANILSSSLSLGGGVIDGLVHDNIEVTLEQLKVLKLPALRDES
ncbi:DUF881 domain-containing protein [Sporosarcina thermotolerans]|uniref:DUF881 domain-containing protein n=1 Tax=Sporosarcina thermotolerans TaxID=633404 RepID=A0AAW9A6C6_9BACL|nr:DUF881 domain-containing protein [Sporosarcina thermotolerans]MDW0115815.1 DUF881 domain-containing protein [Sporosarcina thermotolerans]WHT46950.1 DUF881 domain-containing protein [Sporosarcina thermotolerans]